MLPVHQPNFSASGRTAAIDQVEGASFDLLVIGGGITGAGIARDAVMRGLTTVLVERGDFASGTSSKSARVVHGGLRYLESLQFGVVRQSCAERDQLQRLAPHLVSGMPFTLPVYEQWGRYAKVQLGLCFYDWLTRTPDRHQTLSARQLAEVEPAVRQDDLVGAVQYHENIADDARMTLTVVRDAWRRGAMVLNYGEVQALLKAQGQVIGATVRDRLSGKLFAIHARQVVNATGAWNDAIRSLDEPGLAPTVRPNKGIHLVMPRDRLPIRHAVDFPALESTRTMYAIPWRHTCLVGTTDTDYRGDLDQLAAQSEEVEWILASLNRAFRDTNLKAADLISTYAGLRPLVHSGGQKAYRASREHQISRSHSGLISIVGGKLTTHRAMASDVVDQVARQLQRTTVCTTGHTPLDPHLATAADVASLLECAQVTAGRLESDIIQHLVTSYGSQSLAVLQLADQNPGWQRRIVAGLPYLYAEVPFAARNEMACTLNDVMVRRMRLIHEEKEQGLPQAAQVAALLARELDWSKEETARQLDCYRQEVALTGVQPKTGLMDPIGIDQTALAQRAVELEHSSAVGG